MSRGGLGWLALVVLVSCKAGEGQTCGKSEDCASGLDCLPATMGLRCQDPNKLAKERRDQAEIERKDLERRLEQVKRIEKQLASARTPEELERLKKELREAQKAADRAAILWRETQP